MPGKKFKITRKQVVNYLRELSYEEERELLESVRQKKVAEAQSSVDELVEGVTSLKRGLVFDLAVDVTLNIKGTLTALSTQESEFSELEVDVVNKETGGSYEMFSEVIFEHLEDAISYYPPNTGFSSIDTLVTETQEKLSDLEQKCIELEIGEDELSDLENINGSCSQDLWERVLETASENAEREPEPEPVMMGRRRPKN